MGGPDKVMILGHTALDSGNYRWGAELMNHLVFAHPDLQEAKNLEADILEQLGYQSENAAWRNFYLSGAFELRHGVDKTSAPKKGVSPQIMANMSIDLLFGFLAVQLDAKKAENKKITINFIFPDTKQKYTMFLENEVLNFWSNSTVSDADATFTLDRSVLNQILTKQVKMGQAIKSGDVKIAGNPKSFGELMGMIESSTKYSKFNIVTP